MVLGVRLILLGDHTHDLFSGGVILPPWMTWPILLGAAYGFVRAWLDLTLLLIRYLKS